MLLGIYTTIIAGINNNSKDNDNMSLKIPASVSNFISKGVPKLIDVLKKKTPAATTATATTETQVNGIQADFTDLRVKISLPWKSPDIFYKDSSNKLMAPLAKTFGFLFPIQPAMALTFEAEYQTTKPTHTNFSYQHYTSSSIAPITLTGDFPVRSRYDATYVMAGIQFLRSCTRMFNGQDGNLAGAPPVIVRLTGLGFSGYDNLPVVITNCTVSYPDSLDYITFSPFGNSELAKMPVDVNIQLTLSPVFSRSFITNHYSTTKFSKAEIRLLGPDFEDRLRAVGPPPDLPPPTRIPGIDDTNYDPSESMQTDGSDFLNDPSAYTPTALQSVFAAANNLPRPQDLGVTYTPQNNGDETIDIDES